MSQYLFICPLFKNSDIDIIDIVEAWYEERNIEGQLILVLSNALVITNNTMAPLRTSDRRTTLM
jgi:hypothetical protein